MNKTENRKDEFDRALENMKLEPEADLDRLIEKRVKQMMTRISLQVVCVALLVLALVFLGVNPLVNLCNVNPARANEAEEGRASELLQTLSAYVETVYPQTRLYTIGEIEKAGFGKYEIPLCVSTRTQRTYVGKMNVILEMTRGKLEVKSDADGALTHIVHTTVSNAKREGIGDFAAYNEAQIEDLAELPKSARVLLNVRLHEAKALEEILALRRDTIEPVWAQMDTESERFMGGISLESAVLLYDDEPQREQMNAAQLRERYLKNLTLLSEHHALWNGLGLSWDSSYTSGETALSHIQSALTEAQKTNTFVTKNFYLYGSRDDIMDYMEANKNELCTIEDVRLSELMH